MTGKEEYYEAYLYQLLNKSQPISVLMFFIEKKIKQKEKEEKPKRKRKRKMDKYTVLKDNKEKSGWFFIQTRIVLA